MLVMKARNSTAVIALFCFVLAIEVPWAAEAATGATQAPSPTAAVKSAAPGAGASSTRPRTVPTHAAAKPLPAANAGADSSGAAAHGGDLTLKGGQEGTVFRSLTVEAEDRIHVDFERPELKIDLDPEKAPGLDWGSARDVLDRTKPDLMTPFVAQSATTPVPYLGRPWLDAFASGTVARFEPAIDGVERWKLMVVDAAGHTVRTFSGNGNPPSSIAWDGRSEQGAAVSPGLTYSYVFEAVDRAGNKRNFVGKGFSVSAYRLETAQGMELRFSGNELAVPSGSDARAAGATAPILLEAASWLNQSERLTRPIEISARARSAEQATRIADTVTRGLTPIVLGDPARLHATIAVEPDAPEDGAVAIRL
jgi:hypothetical protein